MQHHPAGASGFDELSSRCALAVPSQRSPCTPESPAICCKLLNLEPWSLRSVLQSVCFMSCRHRLETTNVLAWQASGQSDFLDGQARRCLNQARHSYAEPQLLSKLSRCRADLRQAMKGADSQGWACAVCTFINSPRNRSCEMCQAGEAETSGQVRESQLVLTWVCLWP